MRAVVRERGFSLTELVVSLGIFSIVLTMIFAFLGQTRRNLETESSGIETQYGARVAVEELGFHLRQTGYGIRRVPAANRAAWQRGVVWAGPHAFAFNADIDPDRGAMTGDASITFPDGSTYAGEALSEETGGAETYYYTLDADRNDRIEAGDRNAAPAGEFNPAAATANPLDYAVFRHVYGYAGDDEDPLRIDPVTAYLYTNATVEDRYPDSTSPEPLFTYWVTEDLDGNGILGADECVVAPCPPSPTRPPTLYLWGDSDFNGVLSESEKTALRELPVGAPAWDANPLSHGGSLASTGVADPAAAGAESLRVDNADGILPGAFVELRGAGGTERIEIAAVDRAAVPNVISLRQGTSFALSPGDDVEVVPDSLLRAIRTVQLRFGAITPRSDRRGGTRGLEYRVLAFERRFSLPNLITQPAGAV